MRLSDPVPGLLDVLDALVRKSLVQVEPTRDTQGHPLRLYENDRACAALAEELSVLDQMKASMD